MTILTPGGRTAHDARFSARKNTGNARGTGADSRHSTALHTGGVVSSILTAPTTQHIENPRYYKARLKRLKAGAVERAAEWRRRESSYIPSPKDIARLWSYILLGDSDKCWPWQGSKTTSGYGRIGNYILYKRSRIR